MATIESMAIEDVESALQWATDEGWNPGHDDATAFFKSDPSGFLMLRDAGKTLACIAVVKQGQDNAFLGLYICHPQYRGQGYGWTIWQAGVHCLQGRTIGLDGVPEQQGNYINSGFEYHYKNIRFIGKAIGLYSSSELELISSSSNLIVRAAEADDLKSIINLDNVVHGFQREHYLRSWLENTYTRKTLIVKQDTQLVAFGTIRSCVTGFKIGPLIAQRADIAQMLLSALANSYNTDELIVDVPEPNRTAVDLMERLGLTPSFETARMYRGAAPNYQLQPLFGVTSLELG